MCLAADMVVRQLPGAASMSEERAERLLCPLSRRFDSLPEQTQRLKHGTSLAARALSITAQLKTLRYACVYEFNLYSQNLHTVATCFSVYVMSCR